MMKALLYRHVVRAKICAIVDALFAAGMLAKAFRRKGYRCIHIQTLPDGLPFFDADFRRGDFLENIKHRGDLEETLNRVRAYRPNCLLPGIEDSVEIAELLAERLNLPGNSAALSPARRNKYLMHEQLRSHGLPSASQVKAATLDSLLQKIRAQLTYPVVIKPPASSGADGVTLCSSDSEVESAFASLIRRPNQMMVVNEEVIAQEYLTGEEYIVNTVSTYGAMKITDIWESVKTNANGKDFLYDYLELIPAESDVSRQLMDYSKNVLKALEVEYGPAHLEIMVTGRGPVLIEVGARVSGGLGNQLLARKVLGTNQIDWTAEAYASPEEFKRLASDPFRPSHHARLVCLVSRSEGTVRAMPGLDKVRLLPSYYKDWLGVAIGQRLNRTVDLVTAPADIGLVHWDPRQIESDYRRIREIEDEGFFTVA